MPVSTPAVLLSAQNNEGASNPFTTGSFTVVGEDNNMVVLMLGQRYNAAEISAPTMSGGIGAGTLVTQRSFDNTGSGAWRWLGVPAGSYTLSIPGVDSYALRVIEMDGVDQTTPTSDPQSRDYNQNTPEATPVAYDVASATGDRVIAAICATGDPTESQTLVGSEANFAYNSGWYNIQQAAGASPDVEMTWSGSLTTWSSIAFNVRATAAPEPPVLSSPSATATGQTTASLSVTVDSTADVYAVVTTSATAPTDTQVMSGQDHTGAAAAWDDLEVGASAGSVPFTATGLTAGTTYYAHFVADNEDGTSDVESSSSFTTDAPPPGSVSRRIIARIGGG